jgi:hypothetical protein
MDISSVSHRMTVHAFLFVFLLKVTSSADIAQLIEKGPWSGSVFSNPGVVAVSELESKISLKSAGVDIQISKGENDTLVARCKADFLLSNLDKEGKTRGEILVAFPVSGLNSEVVTTSDFQVTVDGLKPALVLRRGIQVSKRDYALRDTAIYGQFDARFHPAKSEIDWGVRLMDKSIYRDSYLWTQSVKPAGESNVCVSYTVTLKPQSISYFKSYHREDADSDLIPFSDIQVASSGDSDRFYFFDYILLSGSTWHGPIESEIIRVEIMPNLNLPSRKIMPYWRHSIGFHPDRSDSRKYGGKLPIPNFVDDRHVEITIKGKPETDLLIAIPVAAIDDSN